jgi:hypothetical protein
LGTAQGILRLAIQCNSKKDFNTMRIISAASRGMRVLSVGLAVLVLSSCVATHEREQPKTERYISPQIEGASQRINLEEVDKAFFSTKGNDLNSWMGAFEKRVNEIYEGPEIVSIDASRETGKLKVVGFIEKNKEPGFQPSEDKLFSLEQTGDVVNNQMPYKVADERGSTYYQGHHSLLDNPFIQALVIGNLLSGAFGPRYYTPFSRTSVLMDHRNSFRNSTGFGSQKAANRQFNSRFKERAYGSGIGSSRRFSAPTGTSSGSGRSWGAPSGSSRSFGQPSGWGGRRPSFGGGRGWGGRRR